MADDPNTQTPAGNTPQDPPADNGSTGNSEDAGETGEKLLTQEQFDKTLTKRLAQERRAWEADAEEKRKKAEMTEAERLKAEKDEADRKATAATDAANARIVKTEARAALADAGVKAERRDYALRMLELSSVTVDDAGNPDAKALKAAVEALLKDIPELKGAGTAAAGAEFPAGGQPNPETMTMPEYMAWRKKQKSSV